MAKNEMKARRVYWVTIGKPDEWPKMNSAPADRSPWGISILDGILVFPDERSAWLDADKCFAQEIRNAQADLRRLRSKRESVRLHLKETADE